MMSAMSEELLKSWQLNDGASEAALRDAASSLSHALPADYLEFMRKHDGGEGFIRDNYLILWRAEELAPFNAEYEVAQYAPGLILFGSSGGGEGYGFDARGESMAVVRVPFIGMAWEHAKPVAKSFTESLAQLARS
jgi:hypothetical protein